MKKLVIFLICFYGVCAHAQPYMLDQIVAIIGSKPIKQSDLESAYMDYRRQGNPMRGDVKCSLFEELLTQKLLINQAEVDSLVVEPSEVDLDLNRRMDYYIQYFGSREIIEDYFKKSIYEVKDDLRPNIHEQKLANKMQQKIIEDIKITPSEVRSFFNRMPKDSIPFITGQVEVAHIVMYPPYNDEAISDVRQRLLELRGRIIAGESFRVMAVMYSEDPTAPSNGGEMPFKSKGELDPEFAKAAWALKNPGDVSRIVQSQFGYHIIQLMAKRGDQVQCRHILMNPKVNPEAIAKVTGRLDTIVRLIRKDSLDWNVAVRYSQDEKTRFNGGLMINGDQNSPLFQSTRFEMTQLDKADLDVIKNKNMKIGEISDPYQSRDEKGKTVYKIIKLKDQTDPHRANLKDDYNFLSNLALNEKMSKVITEWVNDKIETSYIYIEDSFKRCGLSNRNWLKQ